MFVKITVFEFDAAVFIFRKLCEMATISQKPLFKKLMLAFLILICAVIISVIIVIFNKIIFKKSVVVISLNFL